MSLKTRHWIRACAIFLSQETQKEKEEQKAKEQANALQVCIYHTAAAVHICHICYSLDMNILHSIALFCTPLCFLDQRVW